MRPEPIKISLGGEEFTIRPLTLRQIRKIDEVLKNAEMAELDKIVTVIGIGLSRDYSEAAGNLDDMEVQMMDLGPILEKILRVGGMTPVDQGKGLQNPLPGI